MSIKETTESLYVAFSFVLKKVIFCRESERETEGEEKEEEEEGERGKRDEGERDEGESIRGYLANVNLTVMHLPAKPLNHRCLCLYE